MDPLLTTPGSGLDCKILVLERSMKPYRVHNVTL